jgi:hypothetical protein
MKGANMQFIERSIERNVFWILSIFLLGCLLVGHLQSGGEASDIINMSTACEAHAPGCQADIKKVQSEGWQVYSNNSGDYWAETTTNITK